MTSPKSLGPIERGINIFAIDSHHYEVTLSPEWMVGQAFHGAYVASILYNAASLHFRTTLAAQKQPDVLTLHVEYLRINKPGSATVTVTDLKVGLGVSTIQLSITQGNKSAPTSVAFASSTNFDLVVGPSLDTKWQMEPPLKPLPDFAAVKRREPEPNWLPHRYAEALVPFTAKLEMLTLRGGDPYGVCDQWYRYGPDVQGRKIGGTEVCYFTDAFPALSDTMLQNRSPFDATHLSRMSHEWAEQNPGLVAPLRQTRQDLRNAKIWGSTLTLDIEFKRRIEPLARTSTGEEVEFLFVRERTRVVKDGRMDLEIFVLDQDMRVLALASQVLLVMDAARNVNRAKKGESKEKL